MTFPQNKTTQETCKYAPLLGLCGALMVAGQAVAHGGGGDADEQLNIGFYYGHDETFESPADPLEPATLLVDTHPWELDTVFFDMQETNGLLQGYITEFPNYSPLSPDDEELGGHGYYSWQNASRGITTPNLNLVIVDKDDDLFIYDPATLTEVTDSFAMGVDAANHHLTYHVPSTANPTPGDVFTATFQLEDLNGNLATSIPYTLQFRIVPEPGSAAVVVAGSLALIRRRRSR